jgi:GDP-L-fucose synthase
MAPHESMKVLVTGANGLLGRSLKRISSAENLLFTNKSQVDLESYSQTLDLFKSINPTHLMHLAAVVGGVQANSMYPADFFIRNMEINLNVYRAAQITGVKKIISFASTCIFPENSDYPLKVANLHAGKPHDSNFGYAYAKRMLDVLGNSFEKQYGLKSTLLVPANMYGPDERWDAESSHVIPAIVSKIAEAKRSSTPLEVWGTGRAKREFVFSDDIARASLWALRNYEDKAPLILTNGVEISIRELVEIIAKEMDFKGSIIYNESKPEGQLRKPSSAIEFLMKNPNFTFTPIEAGIKKTVQSYLKCINQ